MVSLYSIGLEDVRVDGSLSQEFDALELRSFLREYIDELLADDLALCLRIINACQLVQEPVNSININEVCAELLLKHLDDHLRLALAQQTVIHMDACQVIAYGPDQKCSYYTRVNAA